MSAFYISTMEVHALKGITYIYTNSSRIASETDGRMAEVVGSVQSQGRTTCVSSEVGEYLHWKVKMIKYASDSWVRS